MDLNFDDATLAFRVEVRDFLATNKEHFPRKSYDTAEGFGQHRHWDKVLFDAGLSVIPWPAEYGGRDAHCCSGSCTRGSTSAQERQPRQRNGTSMLAPTLFAHGTQEQRMQVLPKMTGDLGAGLAEQSPAATLRHCGRRRPGPTAAGRSTARRSGALRHRSATGRSGCSGRIPKLSAAA
jgi:alkylation response protein AidB-like acyl-CoA dehydrogenase